SRRNFQLCAAINRGNLDFGTHGSFGDTDWHGEMDVVAFAMKNRVLLRPNDHVKVAGRSGMRARIALARNADSLSIASSSLDTDFDLLVALDRAFAVTDGTRGDVFACPMTTWTGDIEFHAPGGLLDGALTLALRAFAGRFDETIAVAIRAGVLAGDVQANHAPANRCPERNSDLVFEIGSGLRALRTSRGLTATEHTREDVPESARTTAAGTPTAAPCSASLEQVGEVEAVEIELRAWTSACSGLTSGKAAGEPARKTSGTASSTGLTSAARIGLGGSGIDVVAVKAELVVDLALFGIAQDIVGFGKRFELFLRGLVAGIDVGVVLARKLAESFADLVHRSRLLYPKGAVIIFGLSSHN